MAKKPHDDLFEGTSMTFGEHLEELRVCLFRGVIGVAAGCLVGFFVANSVVRFFQSPLERAMEKYYVDKALGDLARDYGDITYEVRRLILDEKLVPDPLQLDVGRLVEALRLSYPGQFPDLLASRYWFTAGDLIATARDDFAAAQRIAAQLVEAEKASSPAPLERVWQSLSDEDRDELRSLADQASLPSAADASRVLAALNRAAGDEKLSATPEFRGLAGPDDETVAELRTGLAAQANPEQARRLNKLLIASLFPGELRTARVSLLSLFTWRPVKVRFQVLNAQEAFMIWMKAALMTGLILASPYVLFQIWTFVAAGLYPHEKHYIYLYLPISLALFFGGASLAFAFVFDPVLNFLFTFNKGMNADFDPRIGEWLSFVLILPLGFGISFQLPLVMLFLNRLGLVSLELYIQQWRVAILIIFIVAMVLTPADPISMLLMAGPLSFLYLMGILMCKYMPRGRNPFDAAYEP